MKLGKALIILYSALPMVMICQKNGIDNVHSIIDTIHYNCYCQDSTFIKKVFFKQIVDRPLSLVFDFLIKNSLKDTVEIKNGRVLKVEIIGGRTRKRILFNFRNKKVEGEIYPASGLDFSVIRKYKIKDEKSYLFNYSFEPLIYDVPLINEFTISPDFYIYSFKYNDGKQNWLCVPKNE